MSFLASIREARAMGLLTAAASRVLAAFSASVINDLQDIS
jgi:hypothetical protein